MTDKKSTSIPKDKAGGSALSPGLTENCTCFNLRKAARAITQAYDSALQPSGIRATQFTLLAVIKAVGPLALSHLAKTLVMDRTTLTRNLRPLEKQDLIRVEPGEDRRVRIVVLTDKGARALTRALPLWRRAQGRIVDDLGRESWAGLLGNLRATVSAAFPE